MSYDPRLLFQRIFACLEESPCKTLSDLSRSLCLSERTIQKAVNLSTGKSFRLLRDEVILNRVKCLFAARPEVPIKELSFGIGFKSASSFARAIKRASGLSPEELRSRVAHELPVQQIFEHSIVNRTISESRHRIKVAGI
jgi:AraC family transcriptional regulator